MSEPQCVEVSIDASVGGKVQIVQFKLTNDFHYNYGERHTIPSDWDQDRIDQWTKVKISEIKEKIDALAQAEQDALLESSDWYRG